MMLILLRSKKLFAGGFDRVLDPFTLRAIVGLRANSCLFQKIYAGKPACRVCRVFGYRIHSYARNVTLSLKVSLDCQSD